MGGLLLCHLPCGCRGSRSGDAGSREAGRAQLILSPSPGPPAFMPPCRVGQEQSWAPCCGGSGVPGGGGLREDTSSPGTAETLVNVGELRLRFEISPMKLVYYPKSIFLYSVWGH